MRKSLSTFRLAVLVFCALCLFGVHAYGQDRDRDRVRDRDEDRSTQHPNGIVQDWSHRHAVYPRFGPISSLIDVQDDPRALLSWQAEARKDWRRERRWRHRHENASGTVRDWSISLGGGGMAKSMFPAKFGFDPNAAVSVLNGNCTADFIVYTVNTTGSGTQPNIVGFNNLYSGPAGSPGICNRAPNPGVDDGVSATTTWSYAIAPPSGGGIVATSPVLSLDGTKVAFVDTGFGFTARFHVLAPKTGEGVATDLQSVTSSPKVISSGFVTQAPVANSGQVTDLVLGLSPFGTGGDTLSSPFVVYYADVAYVGNNVGTLFRIKDVFCRTTVPLADAACASGTPPAPSLDTSWPASGPSALTGTLVTGCPGVLTGPVADGHGNVFVGCSDGKLYGFTSGGVALANSPLTVGDASATGGIVDPPLVDAVNGFVYAVSGTSGVGGVTGSILVQAPSDFSSQVNVALGAAGLFNLHVPVFNDAYFSSGTSSDWVLYALAANIGGTASALYGIGFGGGHVMNSTNVADVFPIVAFEFSPLAEFLTTGGEDRVFESALGSFGGNTVSFNVTGVTTATFPPVLENFATEGSGTTGIVTDNSSPSAQADSIYFGVLGSNTAVKLTQSGLQ